MVVDIPGPICTRDRDELVAHVERWRVPVAAFLALDLARARGALLTLTARGAVLLGPSRQTAPIAGVLRAAGLTRGARYWSWHPGHRGGAT
jgi:hypothetical protein